MGHGNKCQAWRKEGSRCGGSRNGKPPSRLRASRRVEDRIMLKAPLNFKHSQRIPRPADRRDDHRLTVAGRRFGIGVGVVERHNLKIAVAGEEKHIPAGRSKACRSQGFSLVQAVHDDRIMAGGGAIEPGRKPRCFVKVAQHGLPADCKPEVLSLLDGGTEGREATKLDVERIVPFSDRKSGNSHPPEKPGSARAHFRDRQWPARLKHLGRRGVGNHCRARRTCQGNHPDLILLRWIVGSHRLDPGVEL